MNYFTRWWAGNYVARHQRVRHLMIAVGPQNFPAALESIAILVIGAIVLIGGLLLVVYLVWKKWKKQSNHFAQRGF